MKLHEAFNAVADKFGLIPAEVARGAQITKSRMSRFVNGEGIVTHGLDALLVSLDDDAFMYLLNQLASGRNMKVVKGKIPTISEFVDGLDEEETSEMLYALANKVRKQPRESEGTKRKLIKT